MTAPQMDLAGAEPPLIAHDRFPVTVTSDDRALLLTDARLILTVPHGDQSGRMLVWQHPGAPFVDTPWDPARSTIASPLVDWAVATPDGVFVVRRGRGGCCGNRLKGWLPWTPYLMGQLP